MLCKVEINLLMQAKWYLRAAEGGNVRAMYNISLCYSYGEGLAQDPVHAKRWLQLAADCGHKKALYECGIKLCAVCHSLSLSKGNYKYELFASKKN